MAATRRLEHRVAIVTGGGSGVGRACALRFAAEGAGVVVVGRRADKLADTVAEVSRRGGRADSLALDLRDPGAAGHVVAKAIAWGGRLDVLVNCAGSFPSTPFPQVTDAQWAEAHDINLAAPMRLCRAAFDALAASNGNIVNVSSTNAVMGDKASACSAYSSAKAGLVGLTRQLAVELAPRIRVNAVLPGAIDTPMIEGWIDDPRERAAWLERFVPLRRIATPEDIAAVIAFLASPDAAYVTGAAILADGGMSIV
jgi:NAD(P)-dependent dehydrogenase (short-subunit alcohol dehydrogenase family)